MKTRNLSRREVLKLLTVGTAGAYLAGCAPASTPEPTEAPAEEPAEVSGFNYKQFAGETIFISWTKHPITDAVVEHHDEFTELTGINVDYEIVPEQQQRQKNVIQMTAQSSAIDAWESSGFEKPMFAAAGWYHFVEDWLEDPSLTFPDFDRDDIGEGAWRLATADNGRIVGLVNMIPTIMLAYRKDLVEEKGLKLETLDDLAAAAEALHDPPNVYGWCNRGLKNANMSTFSTLLYNFGGRYLDDDGNLAMTSPEVVQAMEYYARLCRDFGPPGITGFNWYEAKTMFLQGQGAFWIDGSDLIATADNPEESTIVGKVDYMIVPEGPGGQFAPGSFLTMSVNPFSKKKEAAWLYCQWSTNKKNQVRALLSGAPAVRSSAWKDPEFVDNTTLPENWIKAASEAPNYAVFYMPAIGPVTEFRDVFGQALTEAIEGGDVPTLLEKAQAEFQPIYDAWLEEVSG